MPEPAVAAALGPPHDRETSVMPCCFQPGTHFARGECHVGLGPLARPEILGAIEPGGAHPVAEREIIRVFDPEPALLGRIDHEQPAERPERLAAQVLLGFLVDDDNALARVGNLRSPRPGRQARRRRRSHPFLRSCGESERELFGRNGERGWIESLVSLAVTIIAQPLAQGHPTGVHANG